ncbi:MAG: magnesium transporter [Flavobacteriales bacterium]|nr:magnesium transporter [Flavobacteriales bacterium]
MKFELTKEFLEQIKALISRQEETVIFERLKELHPADIADIFENLELEEARYVYSVLDEEIAADAIMELDEEFRENLLKLFSNEEIAEQVNILDTDDAADLLGELSEEDKDEVISKIEDREHASDVEELLKYDEDTAGGLMQTEFIKAKENWPVNRCVIELRRQVEEVEKVYSIYVVDDESNLLGILSLKRLLFASPKTLIKDLYQEKNLKYVKIYDSSEHVASIMDKYDLVSIPVVDRQEKLVGRITIDDVVDVIREEAEKDFQMASGISENVEPSSNVLKSTRSRLPWILIGLAGGVMSSQIIKGYEDQIDVNPALAFFIPLIVATAGNVGVQSSAIVVQGLAAKEFQFNSVLRQIGKESLVGIIVGMICAISIFGFNLAVGGDLNLGLTLGISLFLVVVVAAILGAWIPLALNKLKIDPALATGPFITTANDILGLTIYFLVAYLMYLA